MLSWACTTSPCSLAPAQMPLRGTQQSHTGGHALKPTHAIKEVTVRPFSDNRWGRGFVSYFSRKILGSRGMWS